MNTPLFKSFIVMHGDNQSKIAEALNLPQSAISARINGKMPWRQDEINVLRLRWELTDSQTIDVFFTEKVS